ncbi:ribosome biogenesis GTPase [Anseongella ginsenosidimutans]|uniref:Small ribosomal subunit biogenesis GTPase RsgA n=1 Tax=Anseongella ginsenosidimutans TaxID=496056 RepID=A0A4R3KRL1_9SPHI|nr:ribosome small subunit-dependent GTPase A [Anseongella ginsenosidimutans]QEC52219.1 ribosome small subunit-dependent GTPase A [Anseongella ginsenosidimutans]TCS86769.1 ribosome biogenesis GTPase [Anseongella ginsenosidimutans]
MQGIVTKSTGSWYILRDEAGNFHECRIKGKFRIRGISTTNPLAVGDRVEFDPGTGAIEQLYERRNYIIRRATNLSKQAHIIAANIDQALLIVTLARPRTSMGFIDRFLVTAEAYSIPAVLVFNKIDIYTAEGKELLTEIKDIYTSIGYPCLEVSALENINLDDLRKTLLIKTSLFAGHSGAGKSTLINKLIPDLDLKTASISDFSGKGIHTTTFAEMFALPGESGGTAAGYLIDTPGIREFGIFDIKREEISHYFVEMRERFNQCKFDNCRHINEPGCAIIRAVENGEIALSRYESYLSMYEGFDNRA